MQVVVKGSVSSNFGSRRKGEREGVGSVGLVPVLTSEDVDTANTQGRKYRKMVARGTSSGTLNEGLPCSVHVCMNQIPRTPAPSSRLP